MTNKAMTNKNLVLAYARKHKQVTVNDVCRDLGITRGSASQVLTTMANRGEMLVVAGACSRSVAYRVMDTDRHAELLNLVLFGSAGRKA